MSSDKIYTTKTAAEVLHSNKKTIERLCRDKQIKAYKRLGKWYILHEDLIKWVKG